MEHQIKKLADAIKSVRTKYLVLGHVKELHFENSHLTIWVDNAAPLHELEEKEIDHHLQQGMEKVYGENITYELKLFKEHHGHDRENEVPHDVHQ